MAQGIRYSPGQGIIIIIATTCHARFECASIRANGMPS
jgi:hypothetical protein